MSLKEIRDAIESGRVYFGIRQALKNSKKIKKVFVVSDVRKEVVEKLEEKGLKIDFVKQKKEMMRELNLGFGCEVFSLR